MSDLSTKAEMSGTSRRTVVRTAAHAAWAVPAIQIATSVPAFAAVSKRDASLVGTPIFTVSGTPTRVVTASNIVIQNDGETGTIGDLGGVVLTLNSTKGWAATQPNSSGWSFGTPSGDTMTATYTGVIPAGNTTLPSFTVTSDKNDPIVTASPTVIAI